MWPVFDGLTTAEIICLLVRVCQVLLWVSVSIRGWALVARARPM